MWDEPRTQPTLAVFARPNSNSLMENIYEGQYVKTVSPLDVVVFRFMYTTTNRLIARPNKDIIDTPTPVLWTVSSDGVSTLLQGCTSWYFIVLFCFVFLQFRLLF